MVSLVRREKNYQMMKAEVSLGYPKPLAFEYLSAGGAIVPALFPQGITNSLVKCILVFTCRLTLNWRACNCVEMFLHQCRSFFSFGGISP